MAKPTVDAPWQGAGAVPPGAKVYTLIW